MVGMQARLTNIAFSCRPGLQAIPLHIWAHRTNMKIFDSNNKNTISTATLNYGEPLGRTLIFLKIDKCEGPLHHSLLNWNAVNLWQW